MQVSVTRVRKNHNFWNAITAFHHVWEGFNINLIFRICV